MKNIVVVKILQCYEIMQWDGYVNALSNSLICQPGYKWTFFVVCPFAPVLFGTLTPTLAI